MNIIDMHTAFDIELDKVMTNSTPIFDKYQKDYFINTAYLNLINNKINGSNTLKVAFEDNIKRIADLNSLLTYKLLQPTDEQWYSKNEYQYDLTIIDNYMYPITAVIDYEGDLNGKLIPCDIVKHENADKYRWSDINRPWLSKPVILFEDNKAFVYVDPDTITTDKPKLRINYIRKPAWLSHTSTTGENYIPVVPEHMHFEIVSKAVDLALENIEQPRMASHIQLTNMKE